LLNGKKVAKLLHGGLMDNVEIRQAVADIRFSVRNYSQSRDGKTWGWSCDVCGDSKTNSRKARFGVTIKDGTAVCHCFNCGYSAPFSLYLRDFHPAIYERYSVNKFLNEAPTLYDIDGLVSRLDDKTLYHLFYMKGGSTNDWIDRMKQKKINVSKKSFERLYNIYKNTTSE